MNQFKINLIISTLVGILLLKRVFAGKSCTETINSDLDKCRSAFECFEYAFNSYSVSKDLVVFYKKNSIVDFTNMYLNYVYARIPRNLLEKILSPAEYCEEKPNPQVCKDKLKEEGFDQKWGAQALKFALFHWEFKSFKQTKSEGFQYFLHMKTVTISINFQNLLSPKNWCGEDENRPPLGSLKSCKELLNAAFDDCQNAMECGKFIFLNLSIDDLLDTPKQYANYLFEYAEKGDKTTPQSFCNSVAELLSKKPDEITKYNKALLSQKSGNRNLDKTDCLNEILEEGFDQQNGKNCFELAFKSISQNSMSNRSFLWHFFVYLMPDDSIQSLQKAQSPKSWCENNY